MRLWAQADLPPDVPLVARPVGEGLFAVLCIDWPEEVSTVSDEDAGAWEPSREEQFFAPEEFVEVLNRLAG